MIIKAFINYSGRTAAQAKAAKTLNCRLILLPGGTNTNPAVVNPNATVFAGANAIALELPNLTAAAAAEFDAGDPITIYLAKDGSPAQEAIAAALAAAAAAAATPAS